MIYKAEDRCKFCVNYTKSQTCKAFPKGIPEAIWKGDIFHNAPIEGDNGFLFKRIPPFPDIDEETAA